MRFIDEVCNLFDMEVLCDIEPIADRINWEVRYKPTVGIGCRTEEIGFIMTPWFTSLEELNAFCELHVEKFREASKDSEEPAPNATDWLIPTLSTARNRDALS